MLEYHQNSSNEKIENGEQMKKYFSREKSLKFALNLVMSDKYHGEMTEEFCKEVDEHEGYLAGVTYKYFRPSEASNVVPTEMLATTPPQSDWMTDWESKQP